MVVGSQKNSAMVIFNLFLILMTSQSHSIDPSIFRRLINCVATNYCIFNLTTPQLVTVSALSRSNDGLAITVTEAHNIVEIN